MPYSNEHSARLKNPDDFDPKSFRRKSDGTIYGKIKVPESIDVIWGKLKTANQPDDYPIPQALRFPTKDWTVAEAKKWLKDNDIKYISFEPAEPESKINDSKMEIRSYPMELRTDKEENKIVGYSAVFDQLSEDLGWFREKIDKGAFKKSIKRDDIRALFNHDPNYVLGRNKNDTLFLKEDEHGLKVEIIPPDTQWAKDLIISIDRGDINQMSFAFKTIADEWNREDEKNPIRTLKEAKLYDVSPVTFPAYPQTSVGIRTAEEVYKDFNKSLQEKEKLSEDKRIEEVKAQERKAQLRNIKIEMIKREVTK